MNRLVLTLTIVVLLGVFGDARHIHPSETRDDMDLTVLKSRVIDRVRNDVVPNYQSSGFVPMNNIIFFKVFPPCEEGFRRDILGVCREVWD